MSYLKNREFAQKKLRIFDLEKYLLNFAQNRLRIFDFQNHYLRSRKKDCAEKDFKIVIYIYIFFFFVRKMAVRAAPKLIMLREIDPSQVYIYIYIYILSLGILISRNSTSRNLRVVNDLCVIAQKGLRSLEIEKYLLNFAQNVIAHFWKLKYLFDFAQNDFAQNEFPAPKALGTHNP